MGFIYDKDLVRSLFDGAQERYGERNGGYTRIKPEPFLRRGDGTEMAIIERKFCWLDWLHLCRKLCSPCAWLKQPPIALPAAVV